MDPRRSSTVSLAREANVVQHSRHGVLMESSVMKKWSETQRDSKPRLSASHAMFLMASYVKPYCGSIWTPKSIRDMVLTY